MAFQDSLDSPSDTVKKIMSTGILYFNTALISGAIGFMFIEIYKTISEKKRAARLKKSQSIPGDQNRNFVNSNMGSSQVFESNLNADSSRELDIYPSHRSNHQRNPIMIRRRPQAINQSHQRNNSRNPSYGVNYE